MVQRLFVRSQENDAFECAQAERVWIAQHQKFVENKVVLQEALSKIAVVKAAGAPTS